MVTETGLSEGDVRGARRLADPKQVARMRSDLPIYIAVGES